MCPTFSLNQRQGLEYIRYASRRQLVRSIAIASVMFHERFDHHLAIQECTRSRSVTKTLERRLNCNSKCPMCELIDFTAFAITSGCLAIMFIVTSLNVITN